MDAITRLREICHRTASAYIGVRPFNFCTIYVKFNFMCMIAHSHDVPCLKKVTEDIG